MALIQINKKDIISSFLNPVSRISEECCLVVSHNNIYTLVNDSAGSTILYSKIKTPTGLGEDEKLSLNIKDIRKLIKVFECIPQDIFELKIGDNASNISYKSNDLSFKLHLVTDNVIKKSTLSIDKISKLTFDSDFELSNNKIDEILKGSVFASGSDKIYFYTKDNMVYAELTDKSVQETDSITFTAANTYNGGAITTPLPFNLDILRTINNVKYDNLTVKLNNVFKVLLFEIHTPTTLFKYIIPAYTK